MTCELIVVELWMGVGSRKDERDLEELCSLLPSLPIGEPVWERARQLAARCRRDGTPVPSSDLVIAACAFVHEAVLEYEDQHFSFWKSFANGEVPFPEGRWLGNNAQILFTVHDSVIAGRLENHETFDLMKI